jgi:hypothetical protein
VSAFQQTYAAWAALARRYERPLDIRVLRRFGPGRASDDNGIQLRLLKAKLHLRRERLARLLSDAQDDLDALWEACSQHLPPLTLDEDRAASNAIGWPEIFVTAIQLAMARHAGIELDRAEGRYLADRMIDTTGFMPIGQAVALIEMRRRA